MQNFSSSIHFNSNVTFVYVLSETDEYGCTLVKTDAEYSSDNAIGQLNWDKEFGSSHNVCIPGEHKYNCSVCCMTTKYICVSFCWLMSAAALYLIAPWAVLFLVEVVHIYKTPALYVMYSVPPLVGLVHMAYALGKKQKHNCQSLQ